MPWPDGAAFLTTISGCARCGETHPEIRVRRFQRPPLDAQAWATCPRTGEPILVEIHVGEPPEELGPEARLAEVVRRAKRDEVSRADARLLAEGWERLRAENERRKRICWLCGGLRPGYDAPAAGPDDNCECREKLARRTEQERDRDG